MDKCNPNATPCDPNVIIKETELFSHELKEMERIPFREAVGALMFVAVVSRPDIMFSVSRISRYLNNPSEIHWNAVKRIFRYLKGTINFGICYKGDKIDFKAYSDADFAGDVDTRRSTSGYVTMIAGAPVTWSSSRQKCVSRSTTESEYIAASDAVQEVVWMRTFLREIGIQLNGPTPLYVDNQSTIRLVNNAEHHKRTKHIDIKYHYIRECEENGTTKVTYVESKNQLADMFTKPLPKQRFMENRSLLSIFCNK